eukprot:3205268-Lingulodinium_polyedra.AAC.1
MAILVPVEVECRENEAMAHVVQVCIAINGARIKRTMWMLLGWSSRSCFFIEDNDLARREVAR